MVGLVSSPRGSESMRSDSPSGRPGAHLQCQVRAVTPPIPMHRSLPPARSPALDTRLGRLHPATEARLDHIDRLAGRQHRLLLSGVAASLLGMALFVWLYGWGQVVDNVSGDMLKVFYGGSALACASALICASLMLADWYADNALPDPDSPFLG